ncbi:MAG: hypothetical protein AMXMBFR13_18580 [Phycisphaerae bacterium]
MDQWQQQFAKRVDSLREASVRKFEVFAEEVLAGVYESLAAFTSQHDFHSTAPPHQKGVRFYKFTLSEDAYVLMYFRARGIDTVECEYEVSIPGQGCVEGSKAHAAVGEAQRGWVERCFQTGLDDLVSRLAQACHVNAPEPVAV